MITTLNTPTEAFAAVAWLICSADKIGSAEEQQFLYEQVKHLDIFEGCTLVEFQELLGTAFNRLFHDAADGELTIAPEEVASLIQSIKERLPPAHRVAVYEMAMGLAKADGLCAVEQSMLDQLRDGLKIDNSVFANI